MKIVFELLDMLGELLGSIYRFIFEELLKTKDHSLKAEFMSEGEILSKHHRGFCFGNKSLSLKDSYTNAIISGPTGTGKSVSVLIPSILRMNASLVVLDISGELYAKTARAKKQLGGYDVKVFNPANAAKSIGYNPMKRANTSSEINTLADNLIRATLGSNSKDPFWNIKAKDVLSLIIKILKTQAPEYQNLFNVRQLLFKLQSDPNEVDRLFARHADPILMSQYRAFVTLDPKLSTSILATCQASLQILTDDNVAKVTSHDTLDMEAFRHRKTILYVQIPINQMNVLSPLVSIFCTQFFNYTMSKIPHPTRELDIFYLLDESSILKIPGDLMAATISNIRKYRGGILLVYQNALSQLTENYGRENARTILQGAQTKCYFGGANLETTRELQEVLGKYEYEDDKGIKRSRYLMTADEIRTLKSDYAIVLNTFRRPVKAYMKPYFKQRLLNHQSSLPVLEIPTSSVPETLPLLNLKNVKKI